MEREALTSDAMVWAAGLGVFTDVWRPIGLAGLIWVRFHEAALCMV